MVDALHISLASHKWGFQSFLAFSDTGAISVGAQGYLPSSCKTFVRAHQVLPMNLRSFLTICPWVSEDAPPPGVSPHFVGGHITVISFWVRSEYWSLTSICYNLQLKLLVPQRFIIRHEQESTIIHKNTMAI